MDIKIDCKFDGMTIRDYLHSVLGYSGGMVKKLKFRENGICINGHFVTVRYVLHKGDILSLKTEDTQDDVSPYILPANLPLNIVFEDESLTVVSKPPFMPAHPSYMHRLDTVANALAYRYSDKPYVFRPVNRLDRDTSGLMLVARTRLAASKLYEQMTSGRIIKLYIAILSNNGPKEDFGLIRTYIKRKNDSIIERMVCDADEEKSKIAVTVFKVLMRSNNMCVVAASPVTGRTHQLRVHFSYIGCPIMGDTMYGGSDDVIDRHALHSSYLSFTHPNGKKIEIFDNLPDDMKSIIGDNTCDVINTFNMSAKDELIKAAIEEKAKINDEKHKR